jgi:hypothetical protein
VDLETAHAAHARTTYHRWLAVLVGLVAVTGALLATLNQDAGRREGEAQTRASNLAVAVFEQIDLVGYRTAFTTGNAQNVARQSLEWIVREQDAAGSPLQGAYAAIAAVYQGSEGDLTDVAERMARPPRRAGLDPHVTKAFASSVASARGLLRRQNAAAEDAKRFGNRGSRALLALSLLAIAAVLLGVAGVVGSSATGRLALAAVGAVLVLSIATGVTGLLL